MISALSGANRSALLALSVRPRREDDRASPVPTATAQQAAPPPANPLGATAQSLFQALLGAEGMTGATAPDGYAGMQDLLSAGLTRLDTDGDGAISRDELRSALDQQQSAAFLPAGATPGAAPQADMLTGAISALDRDGDGKLSLPEMQAAYDDLQAAADPAIAAGAASSAPKSIYESLFNALASADGSAKSASLRNDVADEFLTLLTR